MIYMEVYYTQCKYPDGIYIRLVIVGWMIHALLAQRQETMLVQCINKRLSGGQLVGAMLCQRYNIFMNSNRWANIHVRPTWCVLDIMLVSCWPNDYRNVLLRWRNIAPTLYFQRQAKKVCRCILPKQMVISSSGNQPWHTKSC